MSKRKIPYSFLKPREPAMPGRTDQVLRSIGAPDTPVTQKIVAWALTCDDEGKWITFSNGRHVMLNEKGTIVKGPKALTGKPISKAGGGESASGEKKPGGKAEENSFYKLKSGGSGAREWRSGGSTTEHCPKGSGHTVINAGDVGDGAHSVNKYLQDDGSLTPEREAIHRKAIDDLFAGKAKAIPAAGEEKTFYFLGGGSASGKGSFTKPETCGQFGLPSKDDMPTIDADEFKKAIPEYSSMKDRNVAAGFAHEESSAMAKRAMEAAFANGYNCTLDGTGDGSVEGVRKKIQQARKAGYKVEAAYATCPTDVAIQRAVERGQKIGRVVSVDKVRSIHKAVSQIFPQVAGEFDHVRLFDTNQGNGKPAKLIAECFRGQEITIHDPKLYQDFLDKGQ